MITINELYEKYVNKFTQFDCLEFVKLLPDNCIDFVVTSPPYNLRNTSRNDYNENGDYIPKFRTSQDLNNGYNNKRISANTYQNFDDNLPYSAYCSQQHQLLKELIRCIKPHGAIYYNIKLRYYKGELDRLDSVFKDINIRQIIRWVKQSTISIHKEYYNSISEDIYLITKKDSTFALNKVGGCDLNDTWMINIQTDNYTEHPAIFPRLLVKKCLSGHIIPEDKNHKPLVFDPYMGSGTTAIVAYNMGFDFIGTELSQNYIDDSILRFDANKITNESLLDEKERTTQRIQKNLLTGKKVNQSIKTVEISKLI